MIRQLQVKITAIIVDYRLIGEKTTCNVISREINKNLKIN